VVVFDRFGLSRDRRYRDINIVNIVLREDESQRGEREPAREEKHDSRYHILLRLSASNTYYMNTFPHHESSTLRQWMSGLFYFFLYFIRISFDRGVHPCNVQEPSDVFFIYLF